MKKSLVSISVFAMLAMLSLCGAAWGANLYVNEAAPNDVGVRGGSLATVEDHYQKLDTAYNAAQNGDTIVLVTDLTCAVQGGGASWRWLFDRNNISITIEAATGTKTMTMSYTSQPCIEVTCDGATLTIASSVNLNLTSVNESTIYKADNAGVASGKLRIYGNITASGNALFYVDDYEELTLSGCTITGTVQYLILSVGSLPLLQVNNCNMSGLSCSVKGFYLRGTNARCDFISFTDNVGTNFSTQVIEISLLNESTKSATYPYSKDVITLNFSNNVFQTSDGLVLQVGTEYSYFNTWSNAGVSYTLNDLVLNDTHAYVCIASHISADGTEPAVGSEWKKYWKEYGLYCGTISNNVLISNGTSDHCNFLGYGTKNITFSGNRISGGNIGLVSKGYSPTIMGNTIVSATTSPYSVLDIVAGDDSVIIGNTLVNTSGTGSTLKFQSGAISPKRCRVKDNIIANYGTGYCVYEDATCGDNDWYTDYNAYYKPTGNMFYLNGNAYANLTALKTQWNIQSTIYKNNDLHSIEAVNPNFDANYKPKSSALKNTGSPSLLKSDGTVLERNSIGAGWETGGNSAFSRTRRGLGN